MREELIFTKEELNRIKKMYHASKGITVTADIHGMDRYQAKRFLKNLIAINREPFNLNVIHGYNHGTVLKDMIQSENLSDRVYHKQSFSDNLGMTELIVK